MLAGAAAAAFAVAMAAGGAGPASAQAASAVNSGYLLVDGAGQVTPFGQAASAGSISGPLAAPIVDGDTTPTGKGYILVGADGGAFAFGDAPNAGSLGGTLLQKPIVAIDVTPSGKGYVMAASDGGVFSFGDAPFLGSLGGMALNSPIVDIALNSTNDGYRMTGADGGVFAFGKAPFRGSMGGKPLNSPMVAILSGPGTSYALIAADGGVFAYDGFEYNGSLGGITLLAPIVDAVISPTGRGYNLLGADGGVFAFGQAPFSGSLFGKTARPAVAILGLLNETPDAVADSYGATEDTGFVVNAANGVLANDTDGDGDALSATLTVAPTGGTLSLASDGSFTYTPNANFNGADSFTYQVSDGHGGTDSATVSLGVASVNDVPVAADDTLTVDEDAAATTVDVRADDSDLDGDALTVVAASDPAHGTASTDGDTVSYTPDANYNGADSFTYTVSDGNGGLDTATVTVTVNAENDAPVAVADAYDATEDTELNVAAADGVLDNDTDVEGSVLAASLVAGPANGTLTLNSDGSFDYTPDANHNGADSFTYTVSDGALSSNTATVTLTVASVNDGPVAGEDSKTVNEDASATEIAVRGNDSDVDGDTLTVDSATDPDHGTTSTDGATVSYTPDADYHGADSFTYTVSDGNGATDTATVSITVTSVNDAPVAANDEHSTDEDTKLDVAAPGVHGNDSDTEGDTLTAVLVNGPSDGALTLNSDGSFSYTPDANFNGSDSFTYKANDGTADSASATVDITVNAVNDAPVADGDSHSTNEDTKLDVAAPGVLGDDSDADGDALTAVLVTGPSDGALTLNSDGSFSYTPDANFNGSDSFTYKANDGTADSGNATVAITVNSVNDNPVAANDAHSTNEDTKLDVSAPGVLGNDSDTEADTLTAVLVDGPDHGALTLNSDGSFDYTPDADFNGSDSFTYKANDGAADSASATVAITVNAVNDAPVAEGDSKTVAEDASATEITVRANDSDVDGDTLTVDSATDPDHGTTSTDGATVSYTPDADYHGADSFTYTVSDGNGATDTATVSITVNSENDAPVADGDSHSTDEDTKLDVAAPGVLGNDSDTESDALTAVLVTGPEHGALNLNSDGSFDYTPAANYNGADSFTYKANDGTADSGNATVSLTVNSVNDAPVADGDSHSTDEDTKLDVAAPGVLGDDSDADGDALTAVLVTGPEHASSFTLNSDGSFSYTPDANFNGSDSFTYKANDGTADSGNATVAITVNSVNDLPAAADDSYQAIQDTALNVSAPGVLDNDDDPVEGSALTAGNASDPANGSVTLNADGSFSYTPDAGFIGEDSFTYDASDGAGIDGATVTLTVVPPNTIPTADATSASGGEDGGAITVTLSGDDADGDALTFDPGTAANGLVSVPGNVICDGNVPNHCTATSTYTPNADFNGADSFTYTVNDGTVDSSAATASITVNAVNDVPSFTKGADSTVLEDSGAKTVNGWATAISAGPANESDQAVTFLVTTDNDVLFSALPTVDESGKLSYTPAANANGSAMVTVKAKDDGGGADTSEGQTFVITVTAVNDAPSFTKGADRNADEDAGALSTSNWATAISKGPADESGQTLAFEVTANDNPSLFSVAPAVSDTGTLTYTPAANKHGVANVTIRITDNGGTANGGSNASATQSFVITVASVNDAPVAAVKAYDVQANMKISLSGLLTGATDPSDLAGNASWSPSFTLGSITVGAGCIGCTVSNVDNAAGSFDFDPPAGGTGSYTATYTVVDNGSPAPGATSAAQTITFNVAGPVVWFVDTTVGAGGTGRLSAPFNTLAAATTAMASHSNERIFVRGGNVTGNVTLQTDGWLVSEAATGISFDTVMNITPPNNTIARPAVNGTQRTLTGTVTVGDNSVVRGFNITQTGANDGLVGTGSDNIVVNQVSVSTATGEAVRLATGSGVVSLTSASSTGAANGIVLSSWNTTGGTFAVTGAGTAGSGGTIANSTGDGISLSNAASVSLARMVVSGSTGNGIYGTNVTAFSLANSTVQNNGSNASLFHAGIQFDNLLGTSSLSSVDVSGSEEDNVNITNTSGTATLTVSNSAFHDNDTTFGAAGLYVDASGSSVMTFTSTTNTFSNNRINGLSVFAQTTGSLTSTVTGGSATNNGNIGYDIESNGTGRHTFDVNGVTATGCADCNSGIHVYKGTSATGTGVNAMAGQIRNNTVNGVDSLANPGIFVHGEGSGQLRISVTGNNVQNVSHRGIYAGLSSGAGNLQASITNNTVNLSTASLPDMGILVESGVLIGDTVSTCAALSGNNVTNLATFDIRVRNRQTGTTLRLPGYTGGATDMTAVGNFLKATNTITDADATNSGTAGITGGGACTAP